MTPPAPRLFPLLPLPLSLPLLISSVQFPIPGLCPLLSSSNTSSNRCGDLPLVREHEGSELLVVDLSTSISMLYHKGSY